MLARLEKCSIVRVATDECWWPRKLSSFTSSLWPLGAKVNALTCVCALSNFGIQPVRSELKFSLNQRQTMLIVGALAGTFPKARSTSLPSVPRRPRSAAIALNSPCRDGFLELTQPRAYLGKPITHLRCDHEHVIQRGGIPECKRR